MEFGTVLRGLWRAGLFCYGAELTIVAALGVIYHIVLRRMIYRAKKAPLTVSGWRRAVGILRALAGLCLFLPCLYPENMLRVLENLEPVQLSLRVMGVLGAAVFLDRLVWAAADLPDKERRLQGRPEEPPTGPRPRPREARAESGVTAMEETRRIEAALTAAEGDRPPGGYVRVLEGDRREEARPAAGARGTADRADGEVKPSDIGLSDRELEDLIREFLSC